MKKFKQFKAIKAIKASKAFKPYASRLAARKKGFVGTFGPRESHERLSLL
jgi:hypothetical protein